uniref:NADH-ubiquinone oxidoreductase chain 3 n=1 Tax=Lutraria maxima TaxID=971267 RepID=A0A343S4N6_9BIVA|nr:NADH dehydrogenase subunit 3 [Lutraria maxima]AUH21202.1 NADH dehydrogenase subunit 3 [Lutraria maxima]
MFLMAVGMMGLAVVVGQRGRYTKDKLVAFECGFDPLSSCRSPFSFRFFVLALLFLIFDVEIVLIVSFCYSLKIVSIVSPSVGLFFIFFFFIILLLGLMHEANEGALCW